MKGRLHISNQHRPGMVFIENKAECGFGLLVQGAKPSETQVVHSGGIAS